MKSIVVQLIFFSFFLNLNFIYSQENIYIPFRKGNLWGFADTNRNIVIQPIYENKYFRNENRSELFKVSKNSKCGVINLNNEIIIDFKYNSIEFGASFISCHNELETDYFTFLGEQIDTFIKPDLIEEVVNLAPLDIKNNGKKHATLKVEKKQKNNENKILKPPTKFKYTINKVADEFQLILSKEQIINYGPHVQVDTFNEKFNRIAPLYIPRSFMKRDSINYYENRYRYRNWLHITNKDSKQGIMNGYGEWIIPCVYDSINPNYIKYSDNSKEEFLLYANKGGKWGLLNLHNDTLLAFDYDKIDINGYSPNSVLLFQKSSHFIAVKNQKYGVINLSNSIIPKFIYDEIKFVENHLSTNLILKKDNKFGYYTRGFIIEPIFENQIEGHLIQIEDKFHNSTYSVLKIIGNDNRQLIGYADPKGFYYYED